uniref:Guanine nucleotide-binding protein subunit gamma n=1 Tax=Felis catus TaxID=9685 RepID=A0ABI7WHA5_FELCA
MIEDKAGWGLVPGLQAPLLHTHSAQRAAAAAPWQLLLLLGWAGPGWAGCAGCAGLPCTHRLPRRRPAALRRAAGAQVSKAAADLMAYCEAHAKEDPLLTPVPASENPFREKKFFCAIL